MKTDRLSHRLFAAALLAIAWPGRAARAEPDDDLVLDAVVVPAQPAFLVADSQFDRMVFGTSTAKTCRDRLDSFLALQLDEVERTCGLTGAQKQKLRLAARGDVKRFFDRVEERRKAFQFVRSDRQRFLNFQAEVTPLQLSLQHGLHGDGSLFAKTIRTTLNAGQVARYEKAVEARKAARYRAKIELAVATIDNAVGLTSEQRRKLLTLAREETRPPRKFSPYDCQVVLLQLARLPEARIKPLFSEFQWAKLGDQFNNARQVEPYLTQNDVMPKD